MLARHESGRGSGDRGPWNSRFSVRCRSQGFLWRRCFAAPAPEMGTQKIVFDPRAVAKPDTFAAGTAILSGGRVSQEEVTNFKPSFPARQLNRQLRKINGQSVGSDNHHSELQHPIFAG